MGCYCRADGVSTTGAGLRADAMRGWCAGIQWEMIRKLKSGEYRIYSRSADKKTGKRKNLGTFSSRAAAEKHERAIQYFKHG